MTGPLWRSVGAGSASAVAVGGSCSGLDGVLRRLALRRDERLDPVEPCRPAESSTAGSSPIDLRLVDPEGAQLALHEGHEPAAVFAVELLQRLDLLLQRLALDAEAADHVVVALLGLQVELLGVGRGLGGDRVGPGLGVRARSSRRCGGPPRRAAWASRADLVGPARAS